MTVTNPAKDLRALERRLRPQGWTADIRGEHPSFTSPEGKVVRTTGTSAGGRGWANFLATLRRYGADLGTDTVPTRTARARVRPSAPVAPSPTEPAPALVPKSKPTPEPRPVVTLPPHPMQAVPTVMMTCRVLRHAWEPTGRSPSTFGTCLALRCLRCGTVRRDIVRPWDGSLLSRGYVYPDAYHERPVGASSAEWRHEWLDRLTDLPAVADDLLPRRLRVVS